MSDIATFFDVDNFAADLALFDGDLATEDGIKTAVIISLFTDARASDDDILPAGVTWRRGCWTDLLGNDPTDIIGSKLWLLSREKMTPNLYRRAEDYARDALNWMLEDQVAQGVIVEAFEVLPRIPGRGGVLGLYVRIERADAPAIDFRFDKLWSATANAV